MTPKKTVENFYKPDVFLNTDLTASLLHDDVLLDWHSSKGFLQWKKADIIAFSSEMSKAYASSKCRISQILADKSLVSVRYSHFVTTIENEREEMLLAHFMVIWEVKDGKLFRGFQMSQLS